jgi:four helix bundle protein
MKVNTYRDFIVWQKSMDLVTDTYKLTHSLPKEEVFGLKSQIRRSVISVPSNIAEGFGRKSNKDFARFLKISIGSLFELQTQLEICFRLKYIEKNIYEGTYNQTREVERMLSSLIRKLNE